MIDRFWPKVSWLEPDTNKKKNSGYENPENHCRENIEIQGKKQQHRSDIKRIAQTDGKESKEITGVTIRIKWTKMN